MIHPIDQIDIGRPRRGEEGLGAGGALIAVGVAGLVQPADIGLGLGDPADQLRPVLRHPHGLLPIQGSEGRRGSLPGLRQLLRQGREQLRQLLRQLTGNVQQLRDAFAAAAAYGLNETDQLPGVERAIKVAAKGVWQQKTGVLLGDVQLQQLLIGAEEPVHISAVVR